jgi:hypothetical protein
MLELLLSTSLSCPDARIIISRMEEHRQNLGNQVIDELIYEVKNYVPECFNDEGSVHD